MLLEAKVGIGNNLANGTRNNLRTDDKGSLLVVQGGGKYAELAREAKLFAVCNQAAVAVTAALATTYTGLVVGNPTDSSVDLIMLEASYGADAAIPAATGLGLMTGSGASVASSLTPRNRYIGGASSAAWAEDSCTLPGTPVLDKMLCYAFAEATTAGTLGPANVVDLNGQIVLPPGAFVAFYSTAALSAACLFSFLWEERAR